MKRVLHNKIEYPEVDIYSAEGIENLADEDEIENWELGFMIGYIEESAEEIA